jgi:hypothetical protein
VGGVGSVGVVVAAPVFDDHAASRSESKRHELSSSSRSRPLNDSIQAFCQGDPGSMKSEPVALKSAPVMHGVRHELGAVVEAHVVRRPVFEGQTIQDIDDAVDVDGPIDFDRERVNSSITFNIFTVRPSAAVSNWKSLAQITFGRIVDITPTATPIPVKRFVLRRCGTRRPSSRHNRRMRLSLTCQPARRAILAALRHAQRGRSTENRRNQPRNLASSVVIGGGSRRIVERWIPTTVQARRSDTPNRWNSGIPYRLKQYIDLIHQPGVLWTLDPRPGITDY